VPAVEASLRQARSLWLLLEARNCRSLQLFPDSGRYDVRWLPSRAPLAYGPYDIPSNFLRRPEKIAIPSVPTHTNEVKGLLDACIAILSDSAVEDPLTKEVFGTVSSILALVPVSPFALRRGMEFHHHQQGPCGQRRDDGRQKSYAIVGVLSQPMRGTENHYPRTERG